MIMPQEIINPEDLTVHVELTETELPHSQRLEFRFLGDTLAITYHNNGHSVTLAPVPYRQLGLYVPALDALK